MKTFNGKKSGLSGSLTTSDIDSSGALDIDAGTGNVTIDSAAGSITLGAALADAKTLKLGKNGATEMVFTPHGTAANEKISLTNTAGTAADAISLTSTAGGITLDAASGVIVEGGTTAAAHILFKEADNGTNGVKLIGRASTANITVTLPAATDTLVGKATTDTLTNKTLNQDGTGNSITNIANASIKASAAIDATKIANGTVTSAEFQHISTLSSNAQTQINSKVSQQAFESLEDEVGDLDDAKAPKASPTFTGVPAAPTAAAGTDTTQVATTAFVKAAIPSNLVGVNATAAELNILDETAVGTPGALAIEASAGDDGVLVYDNSANTISWKTLVTVCFLKGTKITLSDGQHKNIEEIKENDNLLSYRFHDLDNYNQDLEYLMNWYSKDYRGTNSDTLVKQLWENETTQYYIINDKLKVTPEHLLFIRRNGNYEWYPSKNVKKGYYLLTSENNFEEIVTIELVDEKTKVYNLKLQGIMNYYASDYLVHCSSKCDECENNK